jgi:hypothetical protein
MKTALLSLLLLVSLQSASLAEYEYNPRCNYPLEEPSKTTKTVKFPQYGIQMEIPDNWRSMLRTDGVIQILDNSTYKILQCPMKDRAASGYSSYWIYKATKNYMKTIPLKRKGLYFVIRAYQQGLDETIYFDMAIRVQTSVGLVDVAMVEDGSIVESDLKQKEKEYIELANMINLIE